MSAAIAWADLQSRLSAAAISLGGVPLPISWPNTVFAPPSDNPAPWLLVEMMGGAGRPIELGGSTWQDDGRSFVHVLVPTGAGVADALNVVDQLIAMFRSPPFQPVVYARVTADPGGPGSDDGLYWRTSVSAEFYVQTYVARS